MPTDLTSAQALLLFEICQKVAARTRVDDEDDRHDFALHTFERFFAEDRGEVSKERMWAYTQASISGMVKNKRAREFKMVRESMCVNEDGESYFELHLPTVGASQEVAVDAAFWRECLDDLPDWHKDTLSELTDGGTVMGMCVSRGIRPNDAIKATKHARDQVRENGARRQLARARWGGSPRCVHCLSVNVSWERQNRRYRCEECRSAFGVLSKSPLSRFESPWGGTDSIRRFERPCSKVCEASALIRDGATPSDLQEQFGVPYMAAFEFWNAVRSTDWIAPLVGQSPLVAQSDRAPDSESGGRGFESRRAGQSPKRKKKPAPAPAPEPCNSGSWDAEDIRLLCERWEGGFTATEIAAELSRSRNAVLGKIHRLGLLKIERAA